MSSVREIADTAGVSIATVSRVLNNHPRVSEEARRKVTEAVNRTRYVASVGRRSTTNVAFVYTSDFSLGSPFDATLLERVSRSLQQTGLDLLILRAPSRLSPRESYSQLFQSRGVRGAFVRCTDNTRQIAEKIADEGFPAVTIADRLESPQANWVRSSAVHATTQAIEHLVHLGHRRIAVTLNVVDDLDHRERLDAYLSAMQAAGLEVTDDLFLRVPAYRQAGAAALRQITTMADPPTAVFVTDPHVAIGLMQEALRVKYRIPEQLSVVGFDDTEQRLSVYPAMSAVCQDTEALGGEAYAILERLLNENDATPEQRQIECWLELHDSTAPPART